MTKNMVSLLTEPGLHGGFAHMLSRGARVALRSDFRQAVMQVLKPEEARFEWLVEGGKHGVDWMISKALLEPVEVRGSDEPWCSWA